MSGGKPVYAPKEQSLLPGLKPHISVRPEDRRPWSDGRGNKVDAPRRSGPTFGGKTVVPLVGSDGQPIRLGSFQVIQNVRGAFVVIDHSLPMFASDDEVRDRKDSESRTAAIMGREVFSTKEGLGRAMAAMVVLHRDKVAKDKGLPLEPAQLKDLKGQEIRRGDLALCRYERGPTKGTFAICDHGHRPRRIYDLKEKTIRAALAAFEKRCRTHKPAAPKRKPHAGLIGFEPPAGFGSFGGGQPGWMRAEKTCPEPGSLPWKTCVRLYAHTGKWCKTANLIWGDQRPADLEEEANAAREEFLKSAAVELPAKDDEAALRMMRKLPKASKTLVNILLEHFEGTLLEVKLP